MNENKVSLQAIYDEIIHHYSWENYEEAKKRLLRKKYSFCKRNWYYVTQRISKKKVLIMFLPTMPLLFGNF